jgi:hypothetical protein
MLCCGAVRNPQGRPTSTLGTQDAADSFSPAYAEAREGFIAAATAAGGVLARVAHPTTGPAGQSLSTELNRRPVSRPRSPSRAQPPGA